MKREKERKKSGSQDRERKQETRQKVEDNEKKAGDKTEKESRR